MEKTSQNIQQANTQGNKSACLQDITPESIRQSKNSHKTTVYFDFCPGTAYCDPSEGCYLSDLVNSLGAAFQLLAFLFVPFDHWSLPVTD